MMDIEKIYSVLTDTINSIIVDLIERLPYLVAGLLILFLTWLIAAFSKTVFKKLFNKSNLHKSLTILFRQLFTVVIWISGFAIALIVIFPELTPTKLLSGLGIFTLAVGFAFKNTFENFFAGVLLLWRFPFDIGDFIEHNGKVGQVEDITIRMTKLRTFKGELLIVPNSNLFNNYINILTDQSERRIHVNVEVAYTENLKETCQLIKKSLKMCQTINQNKNTHVLAHEFAASGINIEVIWWTKSEPLLIKQSISEVIIKIKETLDHADVEIPYPYRTLVFKNIDSIENTLNAQ